MGLALLGGNVAVGSRALQRELAVQFLDVVLEHDDVRQRPEKVRAVFDQHALGLAGHRPVSAASGAAAAFGQAGDDARGDGVAQRGGVARIGQVSPRRDAARRRPTSAGSRGRCARGAGASASPRPASAASATGPRHAAQADRQLVERDAMAHARNSSIRANQGPNSSAPAVRFSLSSSRLVAISTSRMVTTGSGPARGGGEAGVEGDRADVPARELELSGEERDVELREIDLRREHPRPDAGALLRAGHRELDDMAQPAGEGLVEVAAAVGGEDGDAGEALHALQQVAGLDIGEAVVGVAHLGALAEQRVGLVEEQHRAHALGGVEHALEVLLGLADVLVDHLARGRCGRATGRACAPAPRRPWSCRCRARRRRAPRSRPRPAPRRRPSRSWTRPAWATAAITSSEVPADRGGQHDVVEPEARRDRLGEAVEVDMAFGAGRRAQRAGREAPGRAARPAVRRAIAAGSSRIVAGGLGDLGLRCGGRGSRGPGR